ncbi:hypothetical protein [Labrys neptuniae]
MNLTEYLDGMRVATSAEELEAAIKAPFKHSFRGRTWSQICKVRIEKGNEICAAHAHGRFVPIFGPRGLITLCGETYRMGHGQNSTGVRYIWHYAKTWAIEVLARNGFSQRAAYAVWDECGDYPHRCLKRIEEALAGKLPDPVLDTLIWHERSYGSPIAYTVEQNNADKYDRRATRPCRCGGTLFDWGAGFSAGFDFINWHCNACPDVATEYLSPGRLYEIRSRKAIIEAAGGI